THVHSTPLPYHSFNDPATPEIYTLSLHDALPILDAQGNLLYNTAIYPHPPQNEMKESEAILVNLVKKYDMEVIGIGNGTAGRERSEEHTSELQSRENLVCRLLLEKKKKTYSISIF